jgi:hypothetical protein
MPPPVGGWNSKDPISAMQPTDAISMINWFPRQTDVITRSGNLQLCDTGTNAPVRTLHTYESSVGRKMIAATGGKLFDVTTSIPALLKSGNASDYWSIANMNSFEFWVNGVDHGLVYEGNSFQPLGFTGVDTSTLTYTHVYGERAYFVQANSQTMWYGNTLSMQGALQSFDFGLTDSFSGNLTLLLTISRDGGLGAADILVAVFAGGQAVAYTGTDPGDATNFRKLGTFEVGRPVGRFGVLKTDADVILIASKGYLSLMSVMPMGNLTPEAQFISDKISTDVAAALTTYPVSDDWRMCLWSTGQHLIVNLPTVGVLTQQHVRNTNTGAWTLYQGLNAISWTVNATTPYFGNATGKVCQFGTATNDNGTDILCDAQQAWSPLNANGVRKTLSAVKPVFYASYLPPVGVAIGADFNPIVKPSVASFGSEPVLALWGQATWDVSTWSPTPRAYNMWLKDNAVGFYLAPRVLVAVRDYPVAWAATHFLYEAGAIH